MALSHEKQRRKAQTFAILLLQKKSNSKTEKNGDKGAPISITENDLWPVSPACLAGRPQNATMRRKCPGNAYFNVLSFRDKRIGTPNQSESISLVFTLPGRDSKI